MAINTLHTKSWLSAGTVGVDWTRYSQPRLHDGSHYYPSLHAWRPRQGLAEAVSERQAFPCVILLQIPLVLKLIEVRCPASTSLPIYPAGPSYISAARRRLKNLSFAEDDAHMASHHASLAASRAAEDGAELYPGLGEEKEDRRLLEMDAKEWKKQDHYAVLGLSDLRYLATNDQIIVARGCFWVTPSADNSLIQRSTYRQTAARSSATTQTRRPAARLAPTTTTSSSASKRRLKSS